MVRRGLVIVVMLCIGLVAASGVASAQPPSDKDAFVPLKVSIAIIRLKGAKETGRLPFELWVNTGSEATLRLNTSVAVPVTGTGSDATGKAVQSTSFQMTNLGTTLTCSARDLGDGRFRLDLGIEDSQLMPVQTSAGSDSIRAPQQSFRSTTQVVLRDGQTVQHSLATDKVTGELVKVEITAHVIK
jgi:hypothetical protein